MKAATHTALGALNKCRARRHHALPTRPAPVGCPPLGWRDKGRKIVRKMKRVRRQMVKRKSTRRKAVHAERPAPVRRVRARLG